MEFNTQICTTREQSKRLIDLGLNPNTSDMHHYRWSEGYCDIQSCPPRGSNSNFIPAWSLHRLIEMLPNVISLSKGDLRYKTLLSDSVHYVTMYNDDDKEIPFNRGEFTLYDNIIDCIEWLIKEGYFNKDYLK